MLMQSVEGVLNRMYWDTTVSPPKLRSGDPPPTRVGTSTGAPTTGFHSAGELWLDSAGALFACSASGTPGTWTAGLSGGGGSSNPTPPVTITNTVVGTVPLTITGASGQSADLLDVFTNAGTTAFVVKSGPALPVNGITVTPAATTTSPIISAVGTDPAVGLTIQTRNASAPVNALALSANGDVAFGPAGSLAIVGNAIRCGLIASAPGSVTSVCAINAGGATNYFSMTPGASGAPAVLATLGEANAGITVRGRGSGAPVTLGSTTDFLGFYGAAPVARAAAITAPTTQTASYVQADVQSIVTAVNSIRTALSAIGIAS